MHRLYLGHTARKNVFSVAYWEKNNDLDIDNLSAKHSGDYDGDGIHEVYWKTNDGTAYLRSLMHVDGNIRYANYQSEIQMRQYLVSQGHPEIISEIV